jgi:hypothetical protein
LLGALPVGNRPSWRAPYEAHKGDDSSQEFTRTLLAATPQAA